MGEHEKTEIGTKLTLDDHAHEALEKVKEGFESLGEKVHEVGRDMMGMAKQAAAVAIGFQLSGSIESVKELGEEIFESATHLAEQKKELAGAISMVEKGEQSFEDLAEDADKLNERFESLAISTGNSKEAMLDAFEMIASRSTRSADAVEEMTGKMAIASKNLPGGLAKISEAWRDIESGMVRPKNALIQWMRQTDVVQGSAKKVAKALNQMIQGGQQEKVFALAEEAVNRMAKKMKDVPLTFDQLLVSLRGTREAFYETMGAPMIAAIAPELEHLKTYLEEHREEIERLAKTMGGKVGEWTKIAAEDVKAAFQYLETHSDEIFKALEGGANAIKTAVQFMVAHKELFIGLAAAKVVGGPLGSVAGAGAKMLPAAGAIAGRGAGALAGLGVAGGLAAGGVLMEAVLAWKYGSEQMEKLEKEAGLSFGQMVVNWGQGFDSMFKASNNLANFNAEIRRVASSAQDVHTTDSEMERYIALLQRSGEEAVSAGTLTEGAFREIMEAAERQAGHARAVAAFQSELHAGASDSSATSAALHAQRLIDYYKRVGGEVEASARDALKTDDALRTALAGASGSVEDAMRKLQGWQVATATDMSKNLPPINFGPTTMHIHQDFRNANPDNIAMVFRRDIARSATNRIGSRLSSPFGF